MIMNSSLPGYTTHPPSTSPGGGAIRTRISDRRWDKQTNHNLKSDFWSFCNITFTLDCVLVKYDGWVKSERRRKEGIIHLLRRGPHRWVASKNQARATASWTAATASSWGQCATPSSKEAAEPRGNKTDVPHIIQPAKSWLALSQ